jgi:hypothetical protein
MSDRNTTTNPLAIALFAKHAEQLAELARLSAGYQALANQTETIRQERNTVAQALRETEQYMIARGLEFESGFANGEDDEDGGATSCFDVARTPSA